MADTKNGKEPDTGKAQDGANSLALEGDAPKRESHTARNIIIALVVLVLVAVGVIVAVRHNSSNASTSAAAAAKGTKDNPVKIGVVGATDPQWVEFKQEAEAQGIYVDIVDFQDYTSENPALDAGDLDLNEFQHLLYLANYNVSNNKDLQPIGGTAIFPLGLYSKQVSSVSDIKAGDTIAIPNDETNQARAIGVLESAGLVTLKSEWTAFTTPDDIDTDKSVVKVTALKAEQVANSLGDPTVTAGVINNDYVSDAGLDPNDAIYHDDASSENAHPYINVFVSRKEDVNNETYLKLVKIFQSDGVWQKLNEQSGNTAVSASGFTADELQHYLAKIEEDARNSQ